MASGAAGGFLHIVAAAVTPAVLISAVGMLIMGVHQKHARHADHLRTLAAEHRAESTPSERRRSIRGQMALIWRRVRYVAVAHSLLHAAAVCFVITTLFLTLARGEGVLWDSLGRGVLAIGIVLMLGAITLELLELRLARRTLDLEIRDILESERHVGAPLQH
jgi:hypothetical protein